MMRSVSESVPSAKSTIMGMRTGIRGTTGKGVNGRGDVNYIVHMVTILQA